MTSSPIQPHIQITRSDRVLEIRIDRPDKKNALTQAMYAAMAEALAEADADPAVRVVFITGGSDCFTSGNDLRDFASAGGMTDELPVAVFLRRLVTGKKPIVAAVAGAAIGIGTTLLLHCDLIYASDTSRFQLPFASLGLCPEGGSSVLLPQLVGPAKAAELLLLGEPFDAATAASLGLVNAVLPAAAVVAHGRDIAQKLASRPPAAIQASRALLRGSPDALLETLNVEFGQFGRLLRGPEAAEAVQAFMQKRAPDFSRF